MFPLLLARRYQKESPTTKWGFLFDMKFYVLIFPKVMFKNEKFLFNPVSFK